MTAYAALTVAFAMLTPIVRTTALVDSLPLWFQWYLRPAGDLTIFTAFPWAGFLFAGAATGALIAAVPDQAAEGRLQAWLAAVGAAVIGAGFYAASLPSLYAAPRSGRARRRGSRFASAFSWSRLRRVGPYGSPSAPGSSFPASSASAGSLFIYWIHVELVYGYASWLLRLRLPVWGTFVACAVFCVLMYGAVVLRDRVVSMWRTRGGVGDARQPATA